MGWAERLEESTAKPKVQRKVALNVLRLVPCEPTVRGGKKSKRRIVTQKWVPR
jgi:hypothetical protein